MERENEMIARILIIGKTGVGKSSFINYFLNLNEENGAKTGVGKPCTQNLEKFKKKIDGLDVEVYDTKGMEVEDYKKIVNEIKEEIVKRNSSDEIKDWFHTIFYCFSLGNRRIEETEIKMLKGLIDNVSQNIHIILTNSDSADDDIIEKFKRQIRDEISSRSKIFPVCSIEMKKRNGTQTQKSGKDEILKEVFILLWNDISNRLAEKYSKDMKKKLIEEIERKYEPYMNKFIIEDNVDILDKIEKDIKNDIEELKNEYQDKIEKELEELINFIKKYSYVVSKGEINIEFNVKTEEKYKIYKIWEKIVSKVPILGILVRGIREFFYKKDELKYEKENAIKNIKELDLEGELKKYIKGLLKEGSLMIESK